ncbi:unnamed protein product [Parascedosporium putredinis]|uniref:Uncharacterized protein n=1 Tax=Parascedosporium putredinis TaxID=1442378 RepID=A0A9P1H553_9PEZI|nr:unnamed protein product [Parascedosporium putredinis]CAI7997434.1 unnamed protein product [Parascedosporium putredinis]
MFFPAQFGRLKFVPTWVLLSQNFDGILEVKNEAIHGASWGERDQHIQVGVRSSLQPGLQLHSSGQQGTDSDSTDASSQPLYRWLGEPSTDGPYNHIAERRWGNNHVARAETGPANASNRGVSREEDRGSKKQLDVDLNIGPNMGGELPHQAYWLPCEFLYEVQTV